jgi:hypothetical protein
LNHGPTAEIKDMEALTPIGSHILNKDVKDNVLEDCQNQDKCMDIRGDSIAIRYNSKCIKMMKCNNFGSNFILKHFKKIIDFALVTPKLLAVLDKDNVLTLYLKLDKPREIEAEGAPVPKKQNSNDDKKSKKLLKNGKKGKADQNIEKYFDTTNFDSHLHFETQIQAKQIATHPLKYDILCVYDLKTEIQVIWLDKTTMTQVHKHRLIDNEKEIKTVVFSKDSLICVL